MFADLLHHLLVFFQLILVRIIPKIFDYYDCVSVTDALYFSDDASIREERKLHMIRSNIVCEVEHGKYLHDDFT